MALCHEASDNRRFETPCVTRPVITDVSNARFVFNFKDAEFREE